MLIPDPKQQRQAVEQVLTIYLPHPIARQRAMQLWDNHAKTGRSLALHHYINRLEPLFDAVKRQKSALLQDLIQQFAGLQRGSRLDETMPIPPDPASQVIDVMLTVLLEGMPAFEQDKLRRQLAQFARERGDEIVAQWCEQSHLLLVAPDTALLQELVHRTYLALCELFGPVRADRLMVMAVKQAETLPAALHFPPSQLF